MTTINPCFCEIPDYTQEIEHRNRFNASGNLYLEYHVKCTCGSSGPWQTTKRIAVEEWNHWVAKDAPRTA